MRLVWLDRFPTGITNDELHFVLNAKAVFYRFTNMANNWHPLSLKTIPNETSSELPFLLIAPWVGPLPTTLFLARLPYAINGLFTVYLLYLITKLLTSRTLALITTLIAALNPWMIFVNRTSFDAPLALGFLLWGFYLLLRLRSNWLYLSLIPLLLGFYCYIGTKTIWFPYVLIIAIFSYRHRRCYRSQLWLIVILSLFFYLSYGLIVARKSLRTTELLSPFSGQINQQVAQEKNQSLQNPFKLLLTNNLTVYFKTFIFKYLNNFSPEILFTTGDHTFYLSLWRHGYFYYLDFLLIVFGLLFFYIKFTHIFYLLLFLIALSPLPEAIRRDQLPAYAFHSVLQYPFFYILISGGIIILTQNLKNRFRLAVLFLLYCLSWFNFLDIYFFKYPVFQPEGFDFSRRLLSRYLFFESRKSVSIVVLAKEPNSLFRNYLFYNNLYTSASFNDIQNIYRSDINTINFRQITFTNLDRQFQPKNFQTIIVDRHLNYNHYFPNKYSINHLADNHELFAVFQGKTCSGLRLEPFSHHLNLFDLDIEGQNEAKFCAKFIH